MESVTRLLQMLSLSADSKLTAGVPVPLWVSSAQAKDENVDHGTSSGIVSRGREEDFFSTTVTDRW